VTRAGLPRVVSGGLWLSLVTLTSSGAAFLTSIVLARVLGPDEFGPYATAFFAVSVAGALSARGFPVALTREIAALRARGDEAAASLRFHEAKRAARRGAALATVLAAAAGLLLLLFYRPLERPTLGLSLLLLSSAVPPLAAAAIRRADLSAREAYREIAIVTAIVSPLGFLLTVIAVGIGFGAYGAAAAAVLAATIAALLFDAARSARAGETGVAAGAAGRGGGDAEFARGARRCLGIQAIDMVVWQRSEILFLSLLLPGSPEAGYYGAAYSLTVAAVALVPGALGGALLPVVSAIRGEGGGERLTRAYVRSVKALVLLAFPIIAGGLVLARPIVAAALGPAYEGPAAWPFRIALVGGAIGAIGAASSSLLYAVGGERFILRMGIALAAANVVLDLVLIPPFGAVGAAIANTATQTLAVAIGTAWVAATVARAFPRPSEIARIAAAAALMAGLLLFLGPPGPGVVPLLGRIGAGAAAYGVLVLLMGALDPADKVLAGEMFRRLRPRRPSKPVDRRAALNEEQEQEKVPT